MSLIKWTIFEVLKLMVLAPCVAIPSVVCIYTQMAYQMGKVRQRTTWSDLAENLDLT